MRAWDQLLWLGSGVRPRAIGWSPGPLTAARLARHGRLRRPIRLTLLEHHDEGTRFASPHAYWINERSRVCTASVNGDGPADVVWVFSQDPLPAHARRSLQEAVVALAPAVVLNGVEAYDGYHEDDAFTRLADAGVRVPRSRFDDEDLGVTPVVYKAQREQSARKHREVYRGAVEGYRAFEYVDGRDAEGHARRYRAFWLHDRAWAKDVFASSSWDVSASSAQRVEHGFALTGHERDQIALLARTLGLDFFAVDFLRRRRDDLPVFVDVNVYPTIVATTGNRERGERGQWHVWDTRRRLGLTAAGDDPWEQFDAAMLALTRVDLAPRDEPGERRA